MDNNCECDILNGGFCKRHNVHKSKKGVELCRTRPDYFRAWERGMGPGQTKIKANIEYPSTVGLAKNFGKAVTKHVLSGMKKVTDDQYQERINTCNQCERLDKEHGRCMHPDCGCFVAVKARWASEDCPEKKWPANE